MTLILVPFRPDPKLARGRVQAVRGRDDDGVRHAGSGEKVLPSREYIFSGNPVRSDGLIPKQLPRFGHRDQFRLLRVLTDIFAEDVPPPVPGSDEGQRNLLFRHPLAFHSPEG